MAEKVTIGNCELYLADSREVLPSLVADALICDPPYGVGLGSRKNNNRERESYKVSQMSEKYKAAQEILTSPVMEKAIANAERLAIALKQISELSETKLSVAVFGPVPANGPESSSSMFQPHQTAMGS